MPKPDLVSKLVGSIFGKAAERMAGKLDLAYQIKRADLADVEQPSGGMLVFHSKGAGYAHISFEVYGGSSLEVWQQRVRALVAGQPEALS